MKLTEIIKEIHPLSVAGNADVDIIGVNIDSRHVEQGHLFAAINGTQVDGHKFIAKAIEQGLCIEVEHTADPFMPAEQAHRQQCRRNRNIEFFL